MEKSSGATAWIFRPSTSTPFDLEEKRAWRERDLDFRYVSAEFDHEEEITIVEKPWMERPWMERTRREGPSVERKARKPTESMRDCRLDSLEMFKQDTEHNQSIVGEVEEVINRTKREHEWKRKEGLEEARKRKEREEKREIERAKFERYTEKRERKRREREDKLKEERETRERIKRKEAKERSRERRERREREREESEYWKRMRPE